MLIKLKNGAASMRCIKRCFTLAVLAVLISGGSQNASADLITNGTFDTNLSGWSTTGTTTGVTWVSQTAHVGQQGTPGVAILEQSIDIVSGTSQLEISFDYEWQVVAPTDVDTFLVEFLYESTTGPVAVTLLDQGSDVGMFGPPAVMFSSILSLVDLNVVPNNNGTIRFKLSEVNDTQGTRIELDNVAISAVPEATPLVVWSTLAGIGLVLRQKRKTA